ncbi:MAG: DNA repair protein RecO, partial [Anaerolineae bacterium]
YRDLREDLDKTGHAYYLAELLDRFAEEHDANAPLFELLALTLARLNHLDDPFLTLRFFELHLLSLTGFQPQLHFCVTCGEALEPVINYFHFVDGGTLCPRHGEARPNAEPLPLPVLKVLRYLQTESWEKVAKLQLTPATRQHVEILLFNYITFLLERRLKSAEFLRQLKKQSVKRDM